MKPLTKEDLRKAFEEIEKHPIKLERVFVSEEMMDEIMPTYCETCGGFRPRKRLHTEEECDMHRVWEIMEQ